MKRKIAIFAVLLLAACTVHAQTGPSIGFGWKNGNPGMSGCAKVTDPGCLNSIVLTEITSVTPVVISGSIAFNAVSFTLNAVPPAGVHTYSIVATGTDSAGKAITSAAVTTQVTVPLAPITGFTATYVPGS